MATSKAVLAFARNTGMSAFDHDRPLWRMTLLDGLPNGGAALVIKVHHALTDGIGGIQLANHVVDLERDPGPRGQLPDVPVGRPGGSCNAMTDAVLYNGRRITAAAREFGSSVPRALAHTVRHPVDAMTDTVATAASIARFIRPVTDTESPVMTFRNAFD